MDFHFLDVSGREKSRKARLLKWNSIYTRKYFNFRLVPAAHPAEMLSLEQAVNLYHFTQLIIHAGIEGDIVELGSFTGSTALQIQRVLDFYKPDKLLHLFDRFDKQFFESGKDTLEVLKQYFKSYSLSLPVIHKGQFSETLPHELPDKISLLYIDCGFGAEKKVHIENVLFCLESAYPRMSKGAIGILMDYHDPENTLLGYDSNPGTKDACDIFFKNKPEKVYTLYGGDFSHGFFRKA